MSGGSDAGAGPTGQGSAVKGAGVQSQAQFQSSPWEDSSWEIVGEAPRGEEFFPMQIAPLPSTAALLDPMFADFGGRVGQQEGERWHLPEHLSTEQRARAAKAEEDQGSVRMTTAEIEALKAEAFQQGLTQGQQEEKAAHQATLEIAQGSLQNVVQDLKAQIEESMILITKRSTDLALAIAKKIVDSAVEMNPEYIAAIVREALPLAGGAGIRKVRVSPQDMEFIDVIGVHKIFKEFDDSWVFEADATIRAGCIVETSAGEIDFDLDRAFERLKEKIVSVTNR